MLSDLGGAKYVCLFDSEDFVDNIERRLNRRADRFPPIASRRSIAADR